MRCEESFITMKFICHNYLVLSLNICVHKTFTNLTMLLMLPLDFLPCVADCLSGWMTRSAVNLRGGRLINLLWHMMGSMEHSLLNGLIDACMDGGSSYYIPWPGFDCRSARSLAAWKGGFPLMASCLYWSYHLGGRGTVGGKRQWYKSSTGNHVVLLPRGSIKSARW